MAWFNQSHTDSEGMNSWLVGTNWFWDRLTQQNTGTYVMRSETAWCVGCREQMRNTYSFGWEPQWKKAVCRLRHKRNRIPNTDLEHNCEDWTQDWLVHTRTLHRCPRITWPIIQNSVPHENVWWTCKNVRTSNTAAFWKMMTTGFTMSHKGTSFGFVT